MKRLIIGLVGFPGSGKTEVSRYIEKKGFLKVIPSKPERYAAVSPNQVLIPLVERMSEDVKGCNKVFEKGKSIFDIFTSSSFRRINKNKGI